MQLCIFEDSIVDKLEPICLTRPLVQNYLGASTILAKILQRLRPGLWGLWVRPYLTALTQELFPDVPVNDLDWLHHEATMFVNARWLPPLEFSIPHEPHVGIKDGQIAYIRLSPDYRPQLNNDWFDQIHLWANSLPRLNVPGFMISHPWDLIAVNETILCEDATVWLSQSAKKLSAQNVHIFGNPDSLYIDATATIEAPVVFSTQHGPIIIDQHTHIHAFSRIEGPCYIGPNCVIFGARIRRGTTIGPGCRMGGEVEASIFQGWSNKYHDGFVGHSWIGEWVNLAAGVQISDLRHDYKAVPVLHRSQRLDSGLLKLGAFIGDHTKVGLGVLVNTGSIFGIFCNVLPGPSYAPNYIPSFCKYVRGELRPQRDLDECLELAARVMARRHQELSCYLADIYRHVYVRTEPDRIAYSGTSHQRAWRNAA